MEFIDVPFPVLSEAATETGILRGLQAFETLGSRVTSLDINCDGIDDRVIVNDSGNNGEGEITVVLGNAEFSPVSDVSSLPADRVFTLTNGVSNSAQFGAAVTVADFNGDGKDDLIIGSPGDDLAGENAGSIFVIFADETQDMAQKIADLPAQNLDIDDFGFFNWGLAIQGNTGDRLGAALANFGPGPDSAHDSVAIATGRSDGDNSIFVLKPGYVPQVQASFLPMVGSGDVAEITGLTGIPTVMADLGANVFDPFGHLLLVPDLLTPGIGGFTVNGSFAQTMGSVAVFTRDTNSFGGNTASQLGSQQVINANQIAYGQTTDINALEAGEISILQGPLFAPSGNNYGATDAKVTALDGENLSLSVAASPSPLGMNGSVFSIELSRLVARDAQGNPELTNSIMEGDEGVQVSQPTPAEGEYGGLGQALQTVDLFGDMPRSIGTFWFLINYVLRVSTGVPSELAFKQALVSQLVLSELGPVFALSMITSAREDNQIDATELLLGTVLSILANPRVNDTEEERQDLAEGFRMGFATLPDTVEGGGSIEVFRNFTQTLNPATTLGEENFDTTNGYQIFYGPEAFTGVGWDLSHGDVNGDGIEDLITTAPFADIDGAQNSGAVFTVMGGDKRLRAQDAADGELDAIIRLQETNVMPALRAGLVIEGQSDAVSARFGSHVAAVGDINGDGLNDFAITQTLHGNGVDFDVGQVVVIYGQLNFGGPSISMDQFSADQGFRVEGVNARDFLGSRVSGGWDINGDQRSDLLVDIPFFDPPGEPLGGRILGIYGQEEDFDLLTYMTDYENEDGVTVDGANANQALASPVMIGDLNNDGIGDFAVRSTGIDVGAQAFVVFGVAGDFPEGLSVDDLDGTNGFAILGNTAGTFIPGELAGGQDLNGDDISDLVINWVDSGQDDTGHIDIVFGSDDPFSATLDLQLPTSADAFHRISPIFEDDGLAGFGSKPSIGDFNGDGFYDLIFGAQNTGTGVDGMVASNAGAGVVLFGGEPSFPSEISLDTLDGDSGLLLTQPLESVFLGVDTEFIGDTDGDGLEDLLITDTRGTVHIVFGRDISVPSEIDVTQLDGRDGFRIQSSEDKVSFGLSASGIGDVDGDGYTDFAIQSPNSGAGGFSIAGKVYVIFGGHANLMALDYADGVQDGRILVQNLGIAYQEGVGSMPGDGIFQGSFRNEAVGFGSADYDGDVIDGTNNTILLAGGNDFGAGGAGDDSVDGGDGDDILWGEAGDDMLLGGPGNDILSAGSGVDTMTGGDGGDTFIVAPGEGSNTITDFDLAEDTLDLSLFARADATGALLAAQAGSAVLTLQDGTQITVQGDGVTPESLLASGAFVLNEENSAAEGAPVIQGTAEEDMTLSVDLSGLTDADGYDPGAVSYQWQRGGVDVAGATGSTYTLSQDDVAQQITVVVSFEDFFGGSESVASAPTVPVDNVNDEPTGGPVIQSGSAGVGTTISIRTNEIMDEDGFSRDNETVEWIVGGVSKAFGGTYTLQEEDVGKTISVLYSYVDGEGTLEEGLTSPLFGPVETGNTEPTGQPVITSGGAFEQGATLTVDLSGVEDADGIDETTEQIIWTRNGVEIASAQDQTSYTLTQEDVGAVIRVRYDYTDLGTFRESVLSDATPNVENVNDPLEGPSTVTGDGQVGETLAVSFEQLSDPDGIDRIEVQWHRLDTDFGVVDAIPDATDTSYTITEQDLGFWISPWAQVFDDFGNQQLRTNPGRFVNQDPVGLPAITGAVEPGETVGVDLTGISDPDGLQEDRVSYIWFRNGVEISGATEATYTVEAGEVEAALSVQVTYRDEGNILEVVTSPAVTVLPEPQTITGTQGDDPLMDLTGGVGRDTILALGGNDQLAGGPGNDTLDGGDGTDTAVFAGAQAGYTLRLSPGGIEIEDRTPDGDGNDILTSIELLDFDTEIPLFDGGPMPLDIFDNPVNLTAEEFSGIAELYIAYFNRAPDAIGLYYWASELDRGSTLLNTAISLFPQNETRDTYRDFLSEDGTTLTNTGAFVEAVYTNVLGRDPDTPGFNYWVDELENNENITPANFILALINGAKFGQDTPESLADRIYLSNKVDIGLYYSAIKGLSGVETSRDVMALYTGPDSTTAVVAEIDSIYADALDPDNGEFLMQLVGVIDDPFGVL